MAAETTRRIHNVFIRNQRYGPTGDPPRHFPFGRSHAFSHSTFTRLKPCCNSRSSMSARWAAP